MDNEVMKEIHWTIKPVTDEIAEWDGLELSLHYDNWEPCVFYDMGFGLVGKMADGMVLVTSWRKPKWLWKLTRNRLRKPEFYKMSDVK